MGRQTVELRETVAGFLFVPKYCACMLPAAPSWVASQGAGQQNAFMGSAGLFCWMMTAVPLPDRGNKT